MGQYKRNIDISTSSPTTVTARNVWQRLTVAVADISGGATSRGEDGKAFPTHITSRVSFCCRIRWLYKMAISVVSLRHNRRP
ncbi:hypothetical protein VUR80DRAFT_3669 [Thermomyces stellatus]